MTDTLYDATLRLARRVGIIRTSKATTDGSTTSLTDTNLSAPSQGYDGGTIWHFGNEEFSRISSYDSDTQTHTLLDALSSAVSEGDRYAVASAKYPLDWLIDAINSQLEQLLIPVEDTSTITIADDQTEYDLPADCYDLRQVHVARDTDSDDHAWKTMSNFRQEKTSTGTADKVIFGRELYAGYAVKLIYVKYHGPIYEDSSQIDEFIDIARLIPGAYANLMMKYMEGNQTGDKTLQQRMAIMLQKEQRAIAEHNRMLPTKEGRSPRVLPR